MAANALAAVPLSSWHRVPAAPPFKETSLTRWCWLVRRLLEPEPARTTHPAFRDGPPAFVSGVYAHSYHAMVEIRPNRPWFVALVRLFWTSRPTSKDIRKTLKKGNSDWWSGTVRTDMLSVPALRVFGTTRLAVLNRARRVAIQGLAGLGACCCACGVKVGPEFHRLPAAGLEAYVCCGDAVCVGRFRRWRAIQDNAPASDRRVVSSVCGNCGRIANQLCVRCKAVVYCDRRCQKADWKHHKATCRSHP